MAFDYAPFGLPDAAWQPLPREHHHFGNGEAALWARFTLVDQAPDTEAWVVV